MAVTRRVTVAIPLGLPEIYSAIEKGNIALVMRLVEQDKVDVKLPDALNENLFHVAILHSGILHYLADTQLKSDDFELTIYDRFGDGTSTVHALAITGQAAELNQMLAEDPEVLEYRNSREESVFYWAAYGNQFGLIYHLLEISRDINKKTRTKYLSDCIDGAAAALKLFQKHRRYSEAIEYCQAIIGFFRKIPEEDVENDIVDYRELLARLVNLQEQQADKSTRKRSQRDDKEEEEEKPRATNGRGHGNGNGNGNGNGHGTLYINTFGSPTRLDKPNEYKNLEQLAKNQMARVDIQGAIATTLLMLKVVSTLDETSQCNNTLINLYDIEGNVERVLHYITDEINLYQLHAQDNMDSYQIIAKLIEKRELFLKLQLDPSLRVKTPKELLVESASLWGYDCNDVKRDGNCFFYAVCHQITTQPYSPAISTILNHANQISANLIREVTVKHLQRNHDYYAKFVDEHYKSFNHYLKKMSLVTEWADEVAISAMARELHVVLVIIGLADDRVRIFKVRHPNATLIIGHEPELHYQSLIRNPNLTPAKDIATLIQNTAYLDELPALLYDNDEDDEEEEALLNQYSSGDDAICISAEPDDEEVELDGEEFEDDDEDYVCVPPGTSLITFEEVALTTRTEPVIIDSELASNPTPPSSMPVSSFSGGQLLFFGRPPSPTNDDLHINTDRDAADIEEATPSPTHLARTPSNG
jgi:hypothetical protein